MSHLNVASLAVAAIASLNAMSVSAKASPDTCVTSMYGGGSSTCVILTGATEGPGKGKCWGTGTFGRLGYGDAINRGDNPNEMGIFLPIIDVGTNRLIEQFGNGFQHQCVRLDDGTAKCWGYNNLGQLGQGDTENRGDEVDEMGDFLPAIDVGAGRTVKFISSGTGFSCVILDTDDVKCWGANPFGELGLGDTLNRGNVTGQMGDNLPVVDIGTNVTADEVRCGGYHTCIRALGNNKLKCWGHNIYGQLGLGDTLPRGDGPNEMGDNLPYVDLGTVSTVQMIGIGDLFTCILLTDSKIKCFGFNLDGELGQGVNDQPVGGTAGSMGNNLLYTDVGSINPVFISCGQESCCVLLTGNAGVKCWGFNDRGRLGYGDTQDRGDGPGEMGNNLPIVNVGTGLIVLEVVTLGTHVCTRIDDRIDLKCWGNNGQGRLGHGNTLPRGDGPGEMGDNLAFTPICPTASPTKNPTPPTSSPTTKNPTKNPTTAPSAAPSASPTKKPTISPTYSPTNKPTVSPTKNPTDSPTTRPTSSPIQGTAAPTTSPTKNPTTAPSASPTVQPSEAPSSSPTVQPTAAPSTTPSAAPTSAPSFSPTKKPTTSPSFVPTRSPSRTPTSRPTKAPAASPTSKPTNKPTKRPTKFPASDPTKSPTKDFDFFGPGGAAIGGVGTLDLYFLIDKSGSIADSNDLCSSFKLKNGKNANSCIDLFFEFSEALIDEIASGIGFYNKKTELGLRVFMIGFGCDGSQNDPETFDIIPELTGNQNAIKDGIAYGKATLRSTGGSCPHTALGKIIQAVENTYDLAEERPFRQIVSFTDAIIYDGKGNFQLATVKSMTALNDRCVKSITITPEIGAKSLSAEDFLVQKKYLNVLTANDKKSQFDFTSDLAKLMKAVGTQMGFMAQKASKDQVCSNPSAYETEATFWCGYNEKTQCSNRESCKWTDGSGCSKDTSQIDCDADSEGDCLSKPGCQWTGISCIVKKDEIDCSSYKMKIACKNFKKVCSWKNGKCVAK